jgi:hypothetical protein
MYLVRRVVAVSLAVASISCGGGAGSKGALVPKNPFPSRAVIEKIAATPPKPPPSRPTAIVSTWRFDPTAVAEAQPALDAKTKTLVAGSLRETPEMRCVARELGRFYAEHGAYPDERLRHYMVGACGSTAPGIFTNVWTVSAPSTTTDEQIVEMWKPSAKDLPAAVKGGDVGVHLARKGDRAVLMFAATAKASAALSVSPVDPETNRVIIQGVVAPDTEAAIALVNIGHSEVAQCERDPSLPLPQVAFACVLAAEDENVWIEIATRARGRLLARGVAEILARKKPGSPLEYAVPRLDVPAGQDDATTILGAVNAARTSSGRQPLLLAPKQSAFNAKLAPHMIAAETTGDAETSDLITLGLLAGYDVEGTIRKGDFFFASVSGTSELAHWLEYALEMPLGRSMLLERDAKQIAVGTYDGGGAGVGAVVTTYAFFGDGGHDADATRLLQRIASVRAAKGLPPPQLLGRLPGLVAQAKLVHAAQREPLDGLDRALATDTQRLARSLRGWAFVGSDLDSIELPAELLAPGPLSVSVEVTHFKAENAAWGAYLVYIVIPVATPQRTAATTPTRNVASR